MVQSLVDIARVGYSSLVPFCQQLGSITMNFLNSDNEDAAKVVIELWTSICIHELELRDNGVLQHSIISENSDALISIFL